MVTMSLFYYAQAHLGAVPYAPRLSRAFFHVTNAGRAGQEFVMRAREILGISTCLLAALLAGCLCRAAAQDANTGKKVNSRIAFLQATPNGSPQDLYTMRPD
jgi:hypothetical protein